MLPAANVVGDPGDHRQQQDRLAISQNQPGWPTNAKTKADHHHPEQNAVPQRGWTS
jgi:hypothetical protein